jgi:hypothetical protein
LRVVGGASWPAAVGTVTASWPLVVLQVDSDGVSVDLRSHFLKRLLSRLVRRSSLTAGFGDAWWGARWVDLQSVRLSKRAVVLVSADGSRCRFVALRRARIEDFAAELDRHEISIEPVLSTLSYCWSAT